MVAIIAGGFYGDEGKGKVVGYLAVADKPEIVVRSGSGPQAGHTVTSNVKVTQVPSGLVYPKAKLYIGRGTLINPDIFLKEVKENGLEDRIFVDFGCTVIEPAHIKREEELVRRVGSVGTGVGPARSDRVMRTAKLAKDEKKLQKYLVDVADIVNTAAEKKKNVLIEGVQGYGLSLLDHNYYPYVTSQDTTASQFAADTGIGPKLIDEVIVIYKSYVSRVGEDPKYKPWSDEKAEKMGIEERGSVSGRKRLLSDFNVDMAAVSFRANTGTQAAITCIDRLFPGNESVRDFKKLSKEARAFLSEIEKKISKKSSRFSTFSLISTGPDLSDMIDLR